MAAQNILANCSGNIPYEIFLRIGELLNDKDCDVRCNAVSASGKIRKNFPVEIIFKLGNLFIDKSWRVRSNSPQSDIIQVYTIFQHFENKIKPHSVQSIDLFPTTHPPKKF